MNGIAFKAVQIFTDVAARVALHLRDAEIVKVPFLTALEGCSARRDERRVASHTSEKQRRNAPASAVENGTFAFSASLSASVCRRHLPYASHF
jgi:hypothetical protein